MQNKSSYIQKKRRKNVRSLSYFRKKENTVKTELQMKLAEICKKK